jgi:hypothetical protein
LRWVLTSNPRCAVIFKTAVRGGRTHLIIETQAGEIGCYVTNVADWINAITAVASA